MHSPARAFPQRIGYQWVGRELNPPSGCLLLRTEICYADSNRAAPCRGGIRTHLLPGPPFEPGMGYDPIELSMGLLKAPRASHATGRDPVLLLSTKGWDLTQRWRFLYLGYRQSDRSCPMPVRRGQPGDEPGLHLLGLPRSSGRTYPYSRYHGSLVGLSPA